MLLDQESFAKEALDYYHRLPDEKEDLYTRRYVAPDLDAAAASGKESDARKLHDGIHALTGIMFDGIVWREGLMHDTAKPVGFAEFGGEEYSAVLTESAFNTAEDKYVALIHATAKGAIVIKTKKGEEANLRLLFAEANGPLPAQVVIDLAEGSRLHLFEWHASEGAVGFSGMLREIRVRRGSECTVDILHNEGPGTAVLEHTKADTGQDGKLIMNYVYCGGGAVRSRNTVSVGGHAGRARVSEMVISSRRQKFDINTKVINAAPGSEAALYSAAVAMDESVCYLKGFAGILNGARNSRSFVEEKGMLVGDRAKISSIPSMAIGENMVKATHSSATGPIDQESMFYLMTKGVSEAAAKQLLMSGFFSVPISYIEDSVTREVASSVITEKIRSNGEFGSTPRLSPSSAIWSSGRAAGLEGHYKYRKETEVLQ